ncbi:MAG: hypothetical protein JST54_23295 [Deltaproteobacteria bacterium]|nr:hypothetical protein [Deltaproteobacteria bacterium]
MRLAGLVAVLVLAVGCSGSSTKKIAVGGSCTPEADGKSTECASGLCLALDTGAGFCTQDCAKNPTCPDGYSCQHAGQFGIVCMKTQGCKTDNDCPAGHICDATTSTCYIKVSRALCEPCEDDAQCAGGGSCFTALGSGEKFCTDACDSNGNCPAGYTCENLPNGGKTNQCVPVSGSCDFGKPLCAPCRGDNECGGALDLCVRNVVSGEQFCGTQCAPPDAGRDDCPSGFTCTDLKLDASGSGPYQCVPNSNTCQGYCDTTDPHVQTLECGLGRTCDTDSKQCVPANDGRQCSPCETNDDCAKAANPNNQCIVNTSTNSAAHGETFCAEPCPATGGDAICLQDLGPGFVCSQVGQEHFCTPVQGTCTKGLGRLGDNCSANLAGDCVTGVCLGAGVNNLESICSAACGLDSDCGDSRYHCCQTEQIFPPDGGAPFVTYDCTQRNATNTGAPDAGVCAPPGGAFGDDCSPGRPPCTSGACLDLGTAELCSLYCDTQSCPPDFTCESALDVSTGNTAQVCFPNGGGLAGGDCTFGPAACASGLCIAKVSGNICTVACDTTHGSADCPSGWACTQHTPVAGGGDTTVCIPPDLQ